MNVDECIKDTQQHIEKVNQFITNFVSELETRGVLHDKTKLEEPELTAFSAKKLSELTFGSEEYKKNLEQIGEALQHHYENNRHHPEHHENGVSDMTLIDIVEMFCDWEASTFRHKDGDIYKSINICQERFGISEELTQIFRNTARMIQES